LKRKGSLPTSKLYKEKLMPDKCPVCESELKEKRPSGLFNGYDCPRCGRFVLHEDIEFKLQYLCGMQYGKKDPKKISIISYAIRKMQEAEDQKSIWPNINEQLISAILKNPLPGLNQQLNNMILWIGKKTNPGEKVKIDVTVHQSIMGAINREGFGFVLEQLKDQGLIEGTLVWDSIRCEIETKLSFIGWKYYRELEKESVDSRKAFMAMEYGDKELDEIVEKYFKQAVAHTGFELYRLDEKPKAGLIDDRLRVEIRNSRFLISDLTHENKGAYWEAGYAEGLGKPVIYTCKKEVFEKTKPHFDTNHHLTVIWDPGEIQNAVEILKATIRATLPDEAKLSDE